MRELRNILFIAATHSHNREINGALINNVINNLPHCDVQQTGEASGSEQYYVAPAEKSVMPEPLAAGEAPASLEAVETQHIKALLHRFEGNRKQVAEALGVSERTIYRKLKKLGLN